MFSGPSKGRKCHSHACETCAAIYLHSFIHRGWCFTSVHTIDPNPEGRVGREVSLSLPAVLPRSHTKISGPAPSAVPTEWHKRDKASGAYSFSLSLSKLSPSSGFFSPPIINCLLGSGWVPSLYWSTMTTLTLINLRSASATWHIRIE